MDSVFAVESGKGASAGLRSQLEKQAASLAPLAPHAVERFRRYVTTRKKKNKTLHVSGTYQYGDVINGARLFL